MWMYVKMVCPGLVVYFILVLRIFYFDWSVLYRYGIVFLFLLLMLRLLEVVYYGCM